MFLLIFFLHSCLSSSYVLACLLLMFLLVFFLCSCLSFSYILACLFLTFSLIISSHRLVMNICYRLYILLNQISRRVIKQSRKVFLKVIFRSSLADSFSVKLMHIAVFLTKVMCQSSSLRMSFWKTFSDLL